jgi:carbonic anhydrase
MEISFEHYVATEIAPKLAAHDKPSILLLTCIDYRYAHRIVDLMDSRGLRRKYDVFSLAGAAAGANKFSEWRNVLVEHIKVARSINHPIDWVIILEHRDCGAYKAFFGLDWAKVTPPVEAAEHLREVQLLGTYLKENLSFLKKVDSFLLARDEDDVLQIGT